MVTALILAAGASVTASAATTMSVTLTVTSTVAPLPGSCLLSPVERLDGATDPAFSFTLACSGPDPYAVAIDGTPDAPAPLVAKATPSQASAQRGTARTFTLPAPADVVASPYRTQLRPITAVVQY